MSNMDIRHKGIEYGITTDAPFVGARICAISCSHNCYGCFNQHLILEPYQVSSAQDIIDSIKEDVLSEGIIFGGLEWTEQPEELQHLVMLALEHGLQVMIYTHYEFGEVTKGMPQFMGRDIYIKCGGFIDEIGGYRSSKYDVYLASINQKIFHLGKYMRRD